MIIFCVLMLQLTLYYPTSARGTGTILKEVQQYNVTKIDIFSEMNEVTSMNYVKKMFKECKGNGTNNNKTKQIHGCTSCHQRKSTFIVDTASGEPCIITKSMESMYEISLCHKDHVCSEIDQYNPSVPQCQNLKLMGDKKTNYGRVPLIIPETQKFCRVGNRQLRKCKKPITHIATVNWILFNDKIRFIDNLSLTFGLDYKLLSSYHCEGNCESKDCYKHGCFGDKIFCAHFHCIEKSTCVCTIKEGMQLARWRLHNGDVYPQCWGQTRVVVESENTNQWFMMTNWLRSKFEQSPIKCSDFSSCDRGVIRSFIKDKRVKMIFIQVNEYRQSLDVNVTGPTFELVIPSAFLMLPSIAVIKVMDINSTLIECQIQCHSINECSEGSTSVSNIHYLESLHCWTYFRIIGVGLIIIFVLAIETLCVIVLIDIILNLFFLHGRFSLFFKMIRIILKFFKSSRKSSGGIEMSVFCDSGSVNNDDTQDASSVNSASGLSFKSLSNSLKSFPFRKLVEQSLASRGMRSPDVLHTALGISIVIALIGQISCCSESHIIVSDRKYCKKISSTTQSCELYSTTRIQIPSVEQEICLNMQHNDESYGYLKIKSKEISLQCQPEIAYWTTDVAVNCMKENYCPGLGDFCTISGCSPVIDEYMKSDKFSQTVSFGVCENGDPDLLLNGCFLTPFSFLLAPKACFLTIAALDPKPKTETTVVTCGSWLVTADLEMDINLNGSSYHINVTLSDTNSLQSEKMKMELISKKVPHWISLPECFVRHDDVTYETICNQRGDFSTTRIGALQCPTAKDVQILSKNCKYGPDIVDFKNQDCILRIPEIGKLPDVRKLPIIKPEFYLYDKGNLTIMARLSSEFTIEAQLVLEGVTVNVEYSKPKCVFHKLSFDGCFNCAAGVTVDIDLVVTQRGVINILCPEVPITIPLSVDKTISHYQFKFRYSTRAVNLICQLMCSNIVQFEMIGDLRDGTIIIDDPAGKTHHGTPTRVASFVENMYLTFKAFLGHFGLFTLFYWLQIVFGLIILLCITLILWFIFKMIYQSCCLKKDARQTVNSIVRQLSDYIYRSEGEHNANIRSKDTQINTLKRELNNLRKRSEASQASIKTIRDSKADDAIKENSDRLIKSKKKHGKFRFHSESPVRRSKNVTFM